MRIDFVFSLIMLIPWKSAFFIPPPSAWLPLLEKGPWTACRSPAPLSYNPYDPCVLVPLTGASRFLNASDIQLIRAHIRRPSALLRINQLQLNNFQNPDSVWIDKKTWSSGVEDQKAGV